MIETKDIKKMVAHIMRRDKGIADPQLMHPTREWFIGLGIATLIVLLGSWFCWFIYSSYAQTIVSELPVSEPVVPYQAASIAEAIKIFESKQIKFSEILGKTPDVEAVVVSTSTELLIEPENTPATTTPTIVSEPQIKFIDDAESEAVLAL